MLFLPLVRECHVTVPMTILEPQTVTPKRHSGLELLNEFQATTMFSLDLVKLLFQASLLPWRKPNTKF